MSITCQVCGKKTIVTQTRSYGENSIKRCRVCSDESCESLPFFTYEHIGKRKIKSIDYTRRENDEKSNG